MPSTLAPAASLPLSELRRELTGRVIGPEDPGYDRARTVFSGTVDRRPAVIVCVAGAADVSRVISLARETGLPLAVRSGGHSAAGHGLADGGIVIDLRDMGAMEVDAEERTAWAETGLTARQYTTAAASHGLATGFGDSGSVGIGGITLGGGVGFLARKHGLTIDHLLAADLVTADGKLIRVDAETQPSLFWAIRGGGGNFGVATRFKFRLHPVESVFGGPLVLPATPEVITSFVSAADAAPDELSTIANVMRAPPLPFVPAEHHGRLVVMATMVYAGPERAGERTLAPFRALAEPIADQVRPMTYPEAFPPDQPGYRPVAVGRTLFVDSVDRRMAELILDQLRAASATMAVAQLRVLGGAVARVPADATAFAHRRRGVMVNVAAIYERPDEAALHGSWAEVFAGALRGGDASAYVNFLGDEGAGRVRDAYPGATWSRLAAIKARHDPDNLFRSNQNIPPAPPVRDGD